MAITSFVNIVVALAIGVQLVSAWSYLKARERERIEHVFEKDVERQLQDELTDAIEASRQAPLPPNEENPPLLASTINNIPRVRYDRPTLPPGSHVDLRLQYQRYRFDLDESRREPHLLTEGEIVDGPLTSPMGPAHNATPLDTVSIGCSTIENPDAADVNPKQAERILKRRITRQWMQAYFEVRRAQMQHSRAKFPNYIR